MALFYCDECGELLNSDLYPPEMRNKGNGGFDLVCPECVLMLEEEIEEARDRKEAADCKRDEYGREYEAEQKAIHRCEQHEEGK